MINTGSRQRGKVHQSERRSLVRSDGRIIGATRRWSRVGKWRDSRRSKLEHPQLVSHPDNQRSHQPLKSVVWETRDNRSSGGFGRTFLRGVVSNQQLLSEISLLRTQLDFIPSLLVHVVRGLLKSNLRIGRRINDICTADLQPGVLMKCILDFGSALKRD